MRLGEESQSQKNTYCVISFTCDVQNKQMSKDKEEWLPRVRGERN